jgi:hypothetical protein
MHRRTITLTDHELNTLSDRKGNVEISIDLDDTPVIELVLQPEATFCGYNDRQLAQIYKEQYLCRFQGSESDPRYYITTMGRLPVVSDASVIDTNENIWESFQVLRGVGHVQPWFGDKNYEGHPRDIVVVTKWDAPTIEYHCDTDLAIDINWELVREFIVIQKAESS